MFTAAGFNIRSVGLYVRNLSKDALFEIAASNILKNRSIIY